MVFLEMQEVLRKYLAEFSLEEIRKFPDLSAIPDNQSDISTIRLSPEDFFNLYDSFQEKTSYIPEKLPHTLTSLCIEVSATSGKFLYYFKRLEAHPDWYVLDIFQEGHFQCTFLAMDSDPLPELHVPFAPFYIPVCLLLSKRENLSNNRAFQAFKFTHFLFQHQSVKAQ